MKSFSKLLVFVLVLLAAPLRAATQWGVLVLAHGGSQHWDEQVQQAVQELAKAEKLPVETAFGMADPTSIQSGIEALEKKKVQKIFVLPLFVSSHTDIMRHNRYILGLGKNPEPGYEARRAIFRVPVVLGQALDASPEVWAILADRAKALSQNPQKETVVLIAHGPVHDEDALLWKRDMAVLSDRIRRAGGYRDVIALTMRDDASPEVQEEAVQEMRRTVQEQSRLGSVLIVPLLISKGGVEHKIAQKLEGLDYRFTPEGLLPHPKVLEWMRRQIKEGIPHDRSKSS